MSQEPLTILHLEDSTNDAILIEDVLRRTFPNLTLVWVDSREGFLRAVQDPAVQIILSDYSLPAYDGMTALSEARQARPEIPFIFVSGSMGEDMAVECMKIGATDYVLKSNLKRLTAAVQRALTESDTRMALLEAARVAKVVPWQWDEADDQWLFGYLVKEILGFRPHAFRSERGFLASRLGPEDHGRFQAAFQRACEKGRTDVECRFLHAEDRWIWTRWTMTYYDGKYRGVLQDITELHSTQDALIQSQRLESLGMMLGGITHDFGNLIMAIHGAAEALSLSELSPRQQHLVGLILRSCDRSAEFTRELLRLARKEEAPARIATDLNELSQEAFNTLRHAVPRTIAMRFEPCESLEPCPLVPGQVLQVLMNLGLNARDALEAGGTITLRTGRAELSAGEAETHNRPAGAYATLEVEDTGPGIPLDRQAKVFEAFFTTKDGGRGTGLGLAMVRSIVQQHDGIVQLDSAPGRGTRFRVLLPLMSP